LAEVLDFIRQHPDGAPATQTTDRFGKDADTYLRRLLASERPQKPERAYSSCRGWRIRP
jgi:hypothetical protein